MANINFVAEFAGDNLKLFKQSLGIVFNAEVSAGLKKELRRIIADPQQQKIAVVAAPGASQDTISNEKALLYNLGFADLLYVQPTVALAAYFGYKFTENMPVFSVVIGEDATDVAIILANKTLYSGILDVGIDNCINAIIDFVMEKYKIEVNYQQARDIFVDLASLLPNDTRFVKLPDCIIKAEQVRAIIYPIYEKIIGAINHVLSDASVDIIRQINNTGVIIGGVGANIRGLSEAIYSVIGLQSLIAEDVQNATLIGAGSLLDTPKMLLKLTNNA